VPGDLDAVLSHLEEYTQVAAKLRVSDEVQETYRTARESVLQAWEVVANRADSDARVEDLKKFLAHAFCQAGDAMYYSIGDNEAAMEDFEAALSVDARCVDALSGMVVVYQQGQGEPREALPYAMRLVRIAPERAPLLEYVRAALPASNEEQHDRSNLGIPKSERHTADIRQRLDEAKRRHRDDPTPEHKMAVSALEVELAWSTVDPGPP
jgi:tetratricopeptide (TPR) repeat protein